MRYKSSMKQGLKTAPRSPQGDYQLKSVHARPAPGFSLIELLAVGAILLLVFVLYWGPRTGDTRQREAQAECLTHLQKIYMALDIYATDHGGKFPAVAGAQAPQEALDALVPRYTADTAVFICPGTKDAPLPAGESFRQHRISYAYYMGRQAADAQQPLMSDQQVDSRARASGQDAFSINGKPPGNNHGKRGGNFLFCDGHTESTPARPPFSLMLTQGIVLLNPDAK